MTKESFCLATLILVCKSLPRVEGESMVVGKIMRYAPFRFCCFLIFQVNTRERYREGLKHIPLKNPSSWRRRGKAKGCPSVTEKLQ
jgi:hypothetical protein